MEDEKVKEGEKKIPMHQIAIIKVRGSIGVQKEVRDTLDMLRLYKRNYCAIFTSTPSLTGMVKKVKDYVAWGEIDSETKKLLTEKRGKEKEGKKPFFRLNPPKQGYGRKGIKKAFIVGGALGYRGDKINDLIRRML